MLAAVTAGRIDRRPGRAAIGVDIGGTKVALGLIDAATLKMVARTRIPTRPERGGPAVLRDIVVAVQALADQAEREGRQLTGIGLGVPEIVDLSGRITSSAVIPGCAALPVAKVLGSVAPVRIEADVRAAAFAESVLGAGRWRYYLYVTIGTGISYCAVYEGRPVAGARGGALNIGSSVLADLPLDGQRRRQVVLERVASGSALVEQYAAAGQAAQRAEEVLEAARRGDAVAAHIVGEAARTLGTGLALLANLLDPEAMVVGGGLGSADTPYWSAAVGWARQHMYSDAARDMPIRHAELGVDAGIIGAGLLGLLRETGQQDRATGSAAGCEDSNRTGGA